MACQEDKIQSGVVLNVKDGIEILLKHTAGKFSFGSIQNYSFYYTKDLIYKCH